MRHRSRPLSFGMDRRAWPSFITTEGDASNVEAALGTSHRLTETVCGRDLAILNGRHWATEDFLGRLGDTTPFAGPRSKAQRTDPVEVFGAASAATAKADKPSVRVKTSGLWILPEYLVKRSHYSSGIPGCAPLTFGVIDGFGSVLSPRSAVRTPLPSRTRRAVGTGLRPAACPGRPVGTRPCPTAP
jgi:hypothetical protein